LVNDRTNDDNGMGSISSASFITLYTLHSSTISSNGKPKHDANLNAMKNNFL
jgi:hypothetical protein